MTYLGNAFSLQMLAEIPSTLKVEEVSWGEIPAGVVSVVGHQDTARVLGVPFNRVSITLEKGDILYVAQLQGGRLPEGATTLPEGFSFKYLKVEIVD
jgi:hypothetical protein